MFCPFSFNRKTVYREYLQILQVKKLQMNQIQDAVLESGEKSRHSMTCYIASDFLESIWYHFQIFTSIYNEVLQLIIENIQLSWGISLNMKNPIFCIHLLTRFLSLLTAHRYVKNLSQPSSSKYQSFIRRYVIK